MQVGSLGPIAFEVSQDLVRTWRDYSRTSRTSIATHAVLATASVPEVTGRELDEASLTIVLDARWLNPEKEIKALRELQRAGRPHVLILGGVSQGRWLIEELSEARTQYDPKGRCLKAEMALTLKEYR